jgi:hypothetical protein
VLAASPFAFGVLDGNAGFLEVPAHCAVKILGARALHQVIVLEVPPRRCQVTERALRYGGVARAEEIVLQLGRGEGAEAQVACGICLLSQN